MNSSLVDVLRGAGEEWLSDSEGWDGTARGGREGEEAMAEGIVEMALTLRRQRDFIEMEGDRRDRENMHHAWADWARGNPYVLRRLASDAIGRIPTSHTRVVELAELATYGDLSDKASAYLSSVASMYIAGFEQELYPVARAVLECAMMSLVDAIPGGMPLAMQRMSVPSIQEFKLWKLIDYCHRCGVLSHDATTRAHSIQGDGNFVLHEGLDHSIHHQSARELIENLCVILAEVFPESFDDYGFDLEPNVNVVVPWDVTAAAALVTREFVAAGLPLADAVTGDVRTVPLSFAGEWGYTYRISAEIVEAGSGSSEVILSMRPVDVSDPSECVRFGDEEDSPINRKSHARACLEKVAVALDRV